MPESRHAETLHHGGHRGKEDQFLRVLRDLCGGELSRRRHAHAKLRTSDDTSKNGLGLGLALSRQTLLDHGGDMWAETNGPGARFCLRLPKE